jgi:hypothetical protein
MLNARDLHNNYPLELHGHHSDAIRDQKHVAADIYFQFAQVSVHFYNHNQPMPTNSCAFVLSSNIPLVMMERVSEIRK